MTQTLEAILDENGGVRLLESAGKSSGPRRVLVIILDEEPRPHPNEAALLSEAALKTDWERTEEDEAWAYLQPAK